MVGSIPFDPIKRLKSAVRRGDVAFALGLMGVLVVLMMPLPKYLLDVFLALSLTFSVLVLMTSLFIEKPLEFSAFPTVLLVSTMLRLALNVASTRLILTDGHEGPHAAGEVIRAFGNFIMGGNFVIGIIVFTIVVIVNFVVITKGSGRIAEVSARFSLDAMPGKQMAVDADLSAGLINEEQAKSRRKELEDESNFYGAMDGAAKFVRGDAIAGILITFINVIAGIIIGVAQKGLSLGDAAQTYTLLTVGDGLVSQIPALVVSTAAGMLVSKAGVEGSAEKALFSQLGAYPMALGLSSFLMMVMSLLPGIPFLPFVTLSGITGYSAWRLTEKQEQEEAIEAHQEQVKQEEEKPKEEPISTALNIDSIRLELGYGLLSMVNGEKGKRLTDQIKSLRRQVAEESGFIMPSVRIQDNLQLGSSDYLIRIKEIEAARGDLRSSMLLAMDPQGQPIPLAGEDTIEPAFGLQAKWIGYSLREEAERRGYTVVDATTVLTTHLTEAVRDNISDLLSYADTQKLLEGLEETNKKLISDLIPSQVTTGTLQRILQNLLSERVSIRDLSTILEGLSEIAGSPLPVTQMTEHVRTRLARQITASHLDEGGILHVTTLSSPWEQAFQGAIVGDGDARQLAMAPSELQNFVSDVRQAFETFGSSGESPVILTSPSLRPYVRSIVERFRPATIVMSQTEVHKSAKIRNLGPIGKREEGSHAA
ncbi:MAG: flagellar biosynthesis protein FlhA [bacterium]|nr:flagellar biosynthesis protein FlhA [bacterium]